MWRVMEILKEGCDDLERTRDQNETEERYFFMVHPLPFEGQVLRNIISSEIWAFRKILFCLLHSWEHDGLEKIDGILTRRMMAPSRSRATRLRICRVLITDGAKGEFLHLHSPLTLISGFPGTAISEPQTGELLRTTAAQKTPPAHVAAPHCSEGSNLQDLDRTPSKVHGEYQMRALEWKCFSRHKVLHKWRQLF